MTIAPAKIAQLRQIADIERRCFPDPWPEDVIAQWLLGEGRVFLCAEADGLVAGYISLLYVLDEGYIGNVAVVPEFRRQGLGRALVEAMIRRAGELELAFLTLEARASNHGARALYAGCGFRDVGLRRNYYEKPREDAVLMTWERKCETENA